MEPNELIVCRDASLGYEGQSVLAHLDLTIRAGDYLCIVGDNGSGKSTLLRGLLGLLSPQSGEILRAPELRQGAVGYLPQQTRAQRDFPATVYEVVLSGCLNQKGLRFFYTAAQKSAALMNMGKLGILELKDQSYRDLSGGQQLDPPVRHLLRRLQPRPQGGLSGGAVHSGTPGHVPGPTLHDHPVPQTGDCPVGQHPHVHRKDLRPGHPGHAAAGGPPGGRAPGHRPGDLLAGLGDPLGHHAVVGTHDHHRPLGNVHVGAARHAGDADDRLLQRPQAAQGLGDGVPPGLRPLHGRRIGGGNSCNHLIQCHSDASCT